MTWTAETECRLRFYWEHTELTGAEIAQALGTTRCAVLGKVHRLGLSARAEPLTPPPYAPAKPGRGRPGWAKYPWNTLQVEQSFFAPVPNAGTMYGVAKSFGIMISARSAFRDGIKGIVVRRVA